MSSPPKHYLRRKQRHRELSQQNQTAYRLPVHHPLGIQALRDSPMAGRSLCKPDVASLPCNNSRLTRDPEGRYKTCKTDDSRKHQFNSNPDRS
jgi:hypothetical protein